MKKKYLTPDAEIEEFTIKDAITTSPNGNGGINEGGNDGGDIPEDPGDVDGLIEF